MMPIDAKKVVLVLCMLFPPLAPQATAAAAKGATAAVTDPLPQAVTISITPASSSIAVGGTVQITATVSGSRDTTVSWAAKSISGQAGTITGSGNTIRYTNTS